MTASMCERAGLELGWAMPCDMLDEDGEPCRYHQGVADVKAAVIKLLDGADSRAGIAMAEAKKQPSKALRDYGEGLCGGITGANDVIRKFLDLGTVVLDA